MNLLICRTADKANLSKDLRRAQVFEARAFAPLVAELQRSAADGHGAVATTTLRTVSNPWWGVEAGREVTVTWMYLCRVAEWESQLPSESRRQLPPEHGAWATNTLGDASRASPLRVVRTLASDAARAAAGRLPGRGRALTCFPQYPLTRMHLSALEANALYQLSGHMVTSHAREVRALFQDDD